MKTWLKAIRMLLVMRVPDIPMQMVKMVMKHMAVKTFDVSCFSYLPVFFSLLLMYFHLWAMPWICVHFMCLWFVIA